jgi:hypothetical protein
MGVLDDLISEVLVHTIDSIYHMNRTTSGETPQPPYATDVRCAWADGSSETVSATGVQQVSKAQVRVQGSLDVQDGDRLVYQGKIYRVIEIETPDPDFDGTIPYKILRVM